MALLSEREQLRFLIQQWNENRLDLFNLSQPDENDEFHGVMRFYFQEPGEKVVTKCVRVSSTAKTQIVLEALIEKFCPDLKNPQLFLNKFSIFEIHENGEERKLSMDEHPLIVQLTWHKDDREGRFLFKKIDQNLHGISTNLSTTGSNSSQIDEKIDLNRGPKRFSKKEKKELRKKYQKQLEEEMKKKDEQELLSKKLYEEVPPTTFTRTISNPEAVMKKRREQRLENKLKEMGHGGSLKIYGAELNPNKPYVTLLVGINDRAYKVVRDTLDKYGMEKACADDYVLVEILLPKSTQLSRSLSDLRDIDSGATERYLHDDERPLMSLLSENGDIIFVVKQKSKNKSQSQSTNFPPNNNLQFFETASLSSIGTTTRDTSSSIYQQIMPEYSIEPILIPLDYQNIEISNQIIKIKSGTTIVGSDPRSSQSIIIRDPNIRPKHSVITFVDGVVAVTPLDGLLEVNGLRTLSTQILRDGFIIKIGGQQAFRFTSNQNKSQQNYASPIMSRKIERPKNLKLNQKKELLSTISTTTPEMMDLITETTFGVVDGTVIKRTKSTDTLSEIKKINFENDDLTPRKINKMLQPRMAPPPTHFPESSTTNLPVLIELYDKNVEDDFLHHLILDFQPEKYSFCLIPSFSIYMVVRFRISSYLYCPGISTEERKRHIQIFLDKIAERIFHVVHMNSSNKIILSFWLANVSELLHILKNDDEIFSILGTNLIGKFQTTIEKTYELLVETSRVGLQSSMTSFLKINLEDHHAARDILNQLDDLVKIIRKSRLNAALTIQLFSQLFYFINMYSFNWLVKTRDGSLYLSRQFGIRLRERLLLINRWSEQQGLELAAECHLDRIQQTVNLLITPKTIDQIASLGATTYKLNSLQVRYLLENYISEIGESRASYDLIEHVVSLAQGQADLMSQQDGQKIQLEENSQLLLPFVFPQDGYVVETLHGIPSDMSDFIASLQTKGICRLMPQIGATGSWTIHMPTINQNTSMIKNIPQEYSSTTNSSNSNGTTNGLNGYPSSQASTYRISGSPTIVNISLKRFPGDSIGLSIVAAQGIGDSNVGIYVKKVVEGSAAYRDGRLEMGDQLLSVNGHSLIGITQEQAASKISQTGSDVNFEVAKRSAYTNGIIESLEKGTIPNTSSISHFSQQNNISKLSNQNFIQDSQFYHHNRSASASELFANQPDNISMVSQLSQIQPIGNGKLPAHYKPSNRPIVIQPQRPMPSPTSLRKTPPSPTPIYSQMNLQGRSQSTIPFNQQPQQQQHKPSYLDNYSNLPQINHFRQNSSSNNSSSLPTASSISRPSEATFQVSHFPPAPVKTITGRSSAPLFDHPTRIYSTEMKSTKHMTSEELDSELDAIESKGDAMTENDIARYHELLGRIAELRGPIPLSQSRSTTDFGTGNNNNGKYSDVKQTRSTTNGIGEQHRIVKPLQPLPFMNEMATKLESKKLNEKNSNIFLPKTNLMDSLTEKAIDDVTKQFKTINNISLTPQTEQPSTSTLSSMPRPAMRDNSISPEDKSKKRVQFYDEKQQELNSENGYLNNNLKNDEQEKYEPRSQIVGNNEIYLNDPRQKRLNEIQQKSIKPTIDGTHLAFRDKMRMFATQIGESTPKDKQKVSSAQREIENSNENS